MATIKYYQFKYVNNLKSAIVFISEQMCHLCHYLNQGL
jgi:hypothetical protein